MERTNRTPKTRTRQREGRETETFSGNTVLGGEGSKTS